jgi:hypothetical protein
MQLSLEKNSWTLTNTPPLWPLEFFTVALNEKMSSLISGCDAGKFGHVWDISSSAQKRRELRIFYRDGLAVLNQKKFPNLSSRRRAASKERSCKNSGVADTT